MTPAATNAEILARLDSLLQIVCDLKDRFDASEKTRQDFRSEYDRATGETAKILAVMEHRIVAAEKRGEINAAAIQGLTKAAEEQMRSVDSLGTMVKILTGVLTTIGSAAGLWLIGQLLGLIG